MKFKITVAICMIVTIAAGCKPKKETHTIITSENVGELTMFVGTYTSGSSKGIYTFRFNEENGNATLLSETEVGNPSYLALSSDGKLLYAVSEFNDERAAVNAFTFDKTNGKLDLLNTQKTGGGDPCYIIINDKYVVTSNYSGGSISVLPIAQNGSLLPASDVIKFEGKSVDKERQDKPHLHCVRFTPDNKYLLATDLGTDCIYKYMLNPKANTGNKVSFLKTGSPPAYKVEAGSGPRHLTFSPNGNYAYLINELSGTVIVFEYKDGVLKEIQTILADTVNAKGSADIHISPDGLYIYASNRLKADGIAVFQINQTNGKLTKVGYQLTGIHPRNFIITPNGKFLLAACRDSNIIQVYKRNEANGLLTNTHNDIKIDKPVCIKFAP